jgi:hypothetical protein
MDELQLAKQGKDEPSQSWTDKLEWELLRQEVQSLLAKEVGASESAPQGDQAEPKSAEAPRKSDEAESKESG